MKINSDDDFGFSLVSEEELKAHEELLKKKVEEQSKVVQQTVKKMEETAAQMQDKLHGLRDMIITSVIHTVTNLKRYIFYSEKKYIEKNASKKKYPSYESYCDLSLLMTTLVHIIVIIQNSCSISRICSPSNAPFYSSGNICSLLFGQSTC